MKKNKNPSFKNFARKVTDRNIEFRKDGLIKSSNQYNDSFSSFAERYNRDRDKLARSTQMDNYGDAMFISQAQSRFTGYMPGGKREKEYLSPFSSERGEIDLREQQARKQPWLHKVTRGVGRVGVELAANILQMPGYAGGAVIAGINKLSGGENSMDIFVNNFWVDALEGAKEYYNNELAPVYIKKSVEEGKLWDNIISMDFWATEGASGLAFLLSAFAPGAAVSKFGTGLKISRALGRTNLLGKGKGANILKKADDISAAAGFDTLENAANVIGATTINTLYEAGVEADGALSGYRDNIKERYLKGDITKEQFLELSKKSPEQAMKVFRDNVAILTLPNLMMSKALFGKAMPKRVLDGFATEGTKIIPAIKPVTKLGTVKEIGKTIGKAFSSEALIEEGGQMTSESYHTEDYINEYLGEGSKSVAEAYFDMLKSTEGQKAMFLGTAFGSGAYAFGNYRNKKATNAKRAELAELMTNGTNFFEATMDGIYKKDKDGNILFENNQAVVDNEKVTELGNNIDFVNKLNSTKAFYQALAKEGVPGAQEKVDLLERNVMNNMLYTFAHAGQEGISILKNYLENSPGIDNLLKQLNENTEGNKKNKTEFVNEIVSEAESLRSDLEYYGRYGEFKNKLIENEKDNPYYSKYSTLIRNKYAAIKSNLRYLEKSKQEQLSALGKAKTELRTTEDGKREDSFNELSGLTVKQLRAKGNALGMKGLSGLTKNKLIEFIQDELIFDESQNDMVDSMQEKLGITNELIEDNNDELKGLTSIEKQKEAYSKFRENQVKKEEAEKEASELDEVLSSIRNTNNKTEMNQISIPEKFNSGNALKAIEKVKKEQEEAFKRGKASKVNSDIENNNKELEREKEAAEKKAKAVKFVNEQYNKGEQINTDNLNTDPSFDIFVESDGNTITLANEAGETIVVPIDDAYEALYEENEEFVVESKVLEDTFTPSENDSNPNMIKDNKDARVVITNNKKEGAVSVLFDDLNEAYKFEISPTDKRGYYGISLNPNYKNDASEIYQRDGVTDENFDYLLDNLPFTIILDKASNIHGPLENKTKGDQTVYKETTEKLKKVILKELQKGTKIENIEIKIKGQYSGKIQTEVDSKTGLPLENKISDLFYFGGDVSKINSDNFYVSMDTGELVNSKGDIFPTRRQDFPAGEMYLIIKSANGKEFPLKLNTAKVTNEIAEFLHPLFMQRSKEFAGGRLIQNALGKQQKLNADQLKSLKEGFPEVYNIIKNEGIPDADISIKHVTDFFIYDNTNNVKSRVKFIGGELKIGTESFTPEQLKEDKDRFIKALTSIKRQQVSLKPYEKRDGKGTSKQNYNFSLTNPAYLKYVIENKVLNTNAKLESKVFAKEGLNDPIFKERTTMYISTNNVRVDGQMSQFNEADTVSHSKTLFGDTGTLKKVVPQLFEDGIALDSEIGMYLTAADRKAVETYRNHQSNKTPEEVLAFKKSKGMKRVSSLSPFTGTQNDKSTAGQVRGDVVDTLIREFFSPLQQVNTNLRFAERGLEILEQENKKKGIDVQISKEWFSEELWPIVKKYGELFDQEGYSVYADEFPVMLKIEGERYAGTGDLLVFNNKTKEWGLIDIKTSSINREDDYNSTSSAYKYKEKDIKQQNAYREAYRQTAKIDIAFSKIMPITTPPTVKQGNPTNYIGAKVSYGKKITGDSLFDYLLDVDTSKSIYEILNKKEEATKKSNLVQNIKESVKDENMGEELDGGVDPEAMSTNFSNFLGMNPPQKKNTKTVEKIEADRKAELEKYSNDIVERVEDYEVIDDNGDTLFVQVRHKKDGSKEVLTGTERNKQGNVPKAGAVIGDTFYTDIYEKVTKTGERTAKEASLTGREDKIKAKYNAELKALEESETKTNVDNKAVEKIEAARKAELERRREEAKNKIPLKIKLEEALTRDKEELERTGKVDSRASSALKQMVKNQEDKIDKEYDDIILKEFGEIEYKKTKILRDKKNLEDNFSKRPTTDYIELENREKRLAKYDAELKALEQTETKPNVDTKAIEQTEADIEKRRQEELTFIDNNGNIKSIYDSINKLKEGIKQKEIELEKEKLKPDSINVPLLGVITTNGDTTLTKMQNSINSLKNILKLEIDKANKIEAKYNAELKALKEKGTKTTTNVNKLTKEQVLDVARYRAYNLVLEQTMDPVPVVVSVKNKNTDYYITEPIVENGKLVGGLIAMNIEKSEIVLDKQEYIKVLEFYNKRNEVLNKMTGSSLPNISDAAINLAYSIIIGEKSSPSNSIQEKPGEQNKPEATTKNASKVENETKKEVEKKTNIAEIKKGKGNTLLSKISEENAKDVYKSLRTSGLINNTNRKLISDIINKNKGNDVNITKSIIEFLVNNGVKEETIIENCI